MQKTKRIIKKFLHPPKVTLFFTPVVYAALIYIFVAGKTESAYSYMIYVMSAYSLAVIIASVPKLLKDIKTAFNNSRIMQKIRASYFGRKYFDDLAFRGSVNIYQGMLINFLYVIFRIAAGIRYASVWFISMAVYYFVLGGLRVYLIFSYRRKKEQKEKYRCYRKTALLLFLLNIPIGGMIVLMVRTNSGFTYPGYIIYLSALYTFYTLILSIINLVKFHELGDLILSAAKVLNFISAMMSVHGLQTAMISRFFENGESYRKLMNTLTGSSVYLIVIVTAVYMLIHSRKYGRQVEKHE